MKKALCTLSILGALVFLSCERETTFLITENSVGPLAKSTPTSDLDALFAADSIVRDTAMAQIGTNNTKVEIFEKGGQHLLTLTPNTDSIPTITNVRIMDSRYKTEKGISLKSTFGDIQKQYPIKKIVTTLSSIVIFPKESNLYFTIDKEELPADLRFTRTDIEAVQIPHEAKIKYLMLGWE